MTTEEEVRVVVVPFGTEKVRTAKTRSKNCMRAVLPARQLTGLSMERISA